MPRRGRGDATVPDELRSRGITSREMDVLLLVAEGLSNPEIDPDNIQLELCWAPAG